MGVLGIGAGNPRPFGGDGVQLQAGPFSLTWEQEASKYLALAAYSRLRGDKQSAASALDTLMSRLVGKQSNTARITIK